MQSLPILHEDAHVLAVNKPAGWSTHAPGPYAGQGLYEWLRDREPRWASLAIVHRLDKDTSGVLVFPLSGLANRSLTAQFAQREALKEYVLLTDRPVPPGRQTRRSHLVRSGSRYVSRSAGGVAAETEFELLRTEGVRHWVRARPKTGRTHQIRVHAADAGFPVLGDALYGGSPAPRLCLHAERLTLRHPASGQPLTLAAPVDFSADPGLSLRAACIEASETNAYRRVHGAADGWAGWYVDCLGDFLLSQSDRPLDEFRRGALERLGLARTPCGMYHKHLDRRVRELAPAAAAPRLWRGEAAPDPSIVLENGLSFALHVAGGYSTGLFLDQRENRRRLAKNYVCPGFPVFTRDPAGARVLNVFAYTCAFSVCAARAGALTASLDVSRAYLEWGRRNFLLNGLDPARHEFLPGDAFDWLPRLKRKGRRFDLAILDPPTFSSTRSRGVFRAAKDFGRLVQLALPLIEPGGALLVSTNAASLAAEDFVGQVKRAIAAGGRAIAAEHYVPQPPDFPISPSEPAYLKTQWLRL